MHNDLAQSTTRFDLEYHDKSGPDVATFAGPVLGGARGAAAPGPEILGALSL